MSVSEKRLIIVINSSKKTKEFDILEIIEVVVPRTDKSANFAVITHSAAMFFQARTDHPITFWEQVFRLLLPSDIVKVTALSELRALIEYGKTRRLQVIFPQGVKLGSPPKVQRSPPTQRRYETINF